MAMAASFDVVLWPTGSRIRWPISPAAGGVDIVMDPVGGDRFCRLAALARPAGRLLVVGFTGGEIPTVKVNRLLNNIDVVGVGWGAGP